ncbi:MAG: hypothetical protein ACOZBW_10270 [Thermodesulfobacteriota bacterium]
MKHALFYSCAFLWRKEKYQKKHVLAAWPAASLAQTVFSVRSGTRPPAAGSNSLPALSRKNRLRSAALQWAGFTIDEQSTFKRNKSMKTQLFFRYYSISMASP